MIVDCFSRSPPFPDDVPIADLPYISLTKLQASDDTEVDRLFQACKRWGLFSLDLRDNVDGSTLLNLSDQVLEIGGKVFELDLKEKNKYRLSTSSYDGYKGIGKMIVDNDGNKDRFESYNLSKDSILGLKNVPYPSVISESISTIRSYTELAHSVVTMILDRLDDPLNLPRGTLANMHRIIEPAQGQTHLLKYPPQPAGDRRTSVKPHTDIGSITILFNKLGGLQVVPPQDPTAWEYVRPIPGHAVVNLGNAMVKLTRGLLRSILHRVTYPPGAQAESTRFTLAYIGRPEDTIKMKGLEGSSVIPKLAEGEVEEDLTQKEWTNRGVEAMRGTKEQSMKHGKPIQT